MAVDSALQREISLSLHNAVSDPLGKKSNLVDCEDITVVGDIVACSDGHLVIRVSSIPFGGICLIKVPVDGIKALTLASTRVEVCGTRPLITSVIEQLSPATVKWQRGVITMGAGPPVANSLPALAQRIWKDEGKQAGVGCMVCVGSAESERRKRESGFPAFRTAVQRNDYRDRIRHQSVTLAGRSNFFELVRDAAHECVELEK